MIGPTTLVGIAKVSVFVTSPLELVETVFCCVADGEGDATGDGIDMGVGVGLGATLALALGVGVGLTEALGDGEGEGEIEGVGPGLPPPPPVPPPPVPPPPESGAVEAMIENVLVTDVAAAYVVFPLCEATIEHDPALVNVTTLLVIEQLPDAVNETVKPDELVAETVRGPGIVLLVMAAKVMVCSVLVIVKVFVPFAAS